MEKLHRWFGWKQLDRWIYFLFVIHCLSACVSGHMASHTEIAILLLTALRVFVGPSLRYEWKGYGGILAAFGIFYGTMLISAAYGGQFLEVVRHNNIFRHAHDILLLFVIGLSVRNIDRLDRMLLMIFLSCALMSISFYWQSWHGVQRPMTTYGGVLMTGAILYVIAIPPLLVRILERGRPALLRRGCIVMFLMALLGVFVSGTRGAWLTVSIVCVVLLGAYARNMKKEILSIGLVLLVVLGGVASQSEYFLQRVSSVGNLKEQSQSERLLMWQSAANMFLDHPLLGVGLGNYAEQYQTKYISPMAKETNVTHAHSMYFQFLAETGAVGFCGYAILYGYIVFWAWRRRRNPYGRMLLFSTAALLIFSTTDYTIGSHQAMRFYWVMLGICMQGALLGERGKGMAKDGVGK